MTIKLGLCAVLALSLSNAKRTSDNLLAEQIGSVAADGVMMWSEGKNPFPYLKDQIKSISLAPLKKQIDRAHDWYEGAVDIGSTKAGNLVESALQVPLGEKSLMDLKYTEIEQNDETDTVIIEANKLPSLYKLGQSAYNFARDGGWNALVNLNPISALTSLTGEQLSSKRALLASGFKVAKDSFAVGLDVANHLSDVNNRQALYGKAYNVAESVAESVYTLASQTLQSVSSFAGRMLSKLNSYFK